MDRVTVACVQQRMRLPQTRGDYQDELRRFMRAAERKNARLVVFPELAGVMVVPPLLGDLRSSLLKRADLGRRRSANAWQRLGGSVSGAMASFLKADLRKSIAGMLDVASNDIVSAYHDTFGGLAREFGITLVSPSAYLPDPLDGVIRNIAAVYGPSGELLGTQSKVLLHPEDEDLAQPGSTWDVVQTEIGRIGLMIGSDVLYPEVGRLLAYQGAEALITQGACPEPVLYSKLRSGMLARMQDNQLFGVAAFLVGHNELSRRIKKPYIGKSAIFAPQELTPKLNGVLVEMGNHRSEGVLTAEWDYVALKELWENSDTPVRQQLPVAQAGQMLAQLYERLQQLPRLANLAQLPYQSAAADGLLTDSATPFEDDAEPDELTLFGPSEQEVRNLDDLPILGSITKRWPLGVNGRGRDGSFDSAHLDATHNGNGQRAPEEVVDISHLSAKQNQPGGDAGKKNRKHPPLVGADDETEEMDALS